MKGSLQSIVGRFTELGKKLLEVDENARDTRQRLQQTTGAMLRSGGAAVNLDIATAVSPSPHVLSRDTPYSGTAIRRVHVPDDKVNWAVR